MIAPSDGFIRPDRSFNNIVLTATALTDHRYRLTAGNGDANPTQHGLLAEDDRNLARFDQRPFQRRRLGHDFFIGLARVQNNLAPRGQRLK